jgi:hypothetical protein
MATYVHTPGRYARRAQTRWSAPRRLAALARWLRADLSEVVRIRPVANDSASTALASEQAGTAEQLLSGLSHWRWRLRRRRAAVVLRRHLILGAGVSIVLEAMAVAGVVAQWAPVLPLLAALVGAAIESARTPSLELVAHLLDDQLGLFDRIGTGLDLHSQADIQRGPLAPRAVSDAAGLTELTLRGWRAAAAGAGGEWGSLGAGLAALAALALLVPVHHGRSLTEASTASAGVRGAAPGARRTSVTHPVTSPQKPASTSTAAQQTHQRLSTAATQPQHGAATTDASPRSSAKTGSSGAGATAKSPSKAAASGGTASKAGAAAGASGQTAALGAKGSAGGSATSGAGVSPVAAPKRAASPSASSTTGAAGSRSQSAKSSAGQASAGAKQGGAGQPTGTASAGHERGSTALGNSKPLSGRATRNLPLQAGYAPSGSSKASGAGHSSSSGGGGGQERPATVGATGAAAGSGARAAFTYVPSEGGAVAEGDAALLISYIYSLGFVEEQPW